jgi:hypothetical protein
MRSPTTMLACVDGMSDECQKILEDVNSKSGTAFNFTGAAKSKDSCSRIQRAYLIAAYAAYEFCFVQHMLDLIDSIP